MLCQQIQESRDESVDVDLGGNESTQGSAVGLSEYWNERVNGEARDIRYCNVSYSSSSLAIPRVCEHW